MNGNIIQAKEQIVPTIIEQKIMAWKDIKVDIKIEYYLDKLDLNTPDRVIERAKKSHPSKEVSLELENEKDRVIEDVTAILEKKASIKAVTDKNASNPNDEYKEDNGYAKINTPRGISGNARPNLSGLSEERKAS